MNAKNAKLAYSHFEEYVKLAGEVDGDIFSLLFRSLASKDDTPFLEKWLDFVSEKEIELGENAYTCPFCALLLSRSDYPILLQHRHGGRGNEVRESHH